MGGGGAGPLRIAFVASGDPLDVTAFSGVLFHMARALQARYPDLDIVRASRPGWFWRAQGVIARATGGRVNAYFFRPLNRLFARRLARRWGGRRVLVVGVVNASLVAELAAIVPVLNVSDSTFALMRSFYAHFDRFSARTAVIAEEDERRSIVRSVHNSFSSRWAARSAVAHYGADAAHVSVVSWGCNLAAVDAAEVRAPEAGRVACRLLFMGGDWMRKGGDVVLEAARLLAARGVPVELDLIGAIPADGAPGEDWIRAHGFLSKADPGQAERLRALTREADFLFLPSRQDCTPMVFAEANAYGTPAVTRDIGGVADVVEDGVSGIVLPEAASVADFADAIARAWTDPARYAALRSGARRTYETRLNWDAWARSIAAIVDGLAASGRI